MCYLFELTGSQYSCQFDMRRTLIVRNYAHLISAIFMSLYLYNYTYSCMFVSALSDLTSNSERSDGNKQVSLLLYT